MKKKNILLFLSLIGSLFGHAQVARIDVTVENSPFLYVDRYSFFRQASEVKVEKLEAGHFVLRLELSKPRMYNINFREVWVTPGDTVSLIFRVTDSNPDHHRDTLIAKGKNNANYIFSNKISDGMPRLYYPDESQYRQKLPQLLTILTQNYRKYTKEVEAYSAALRIDTGLAAYLSRSINWQLFYNLDYLDQELGNYGDNRNVLSHFRDSLFANTTFIRSDTAYSQKMESLFENQLKYVIYNKYKFNGVPTQQQYTALIDYVVSYPDPFIKDYFVYFLNENYAYLTKEFNDKRLAALCLINPYIGRYRSQSLDNNNAYQ